MKTKTFKILLGFTFIVVFLFTFSAFRSFNTLKVNNDKPTAVILPANTMIATSVTTPTTTENFDVDTGTIPEVTITADRPKIPIVKKFKSKRSCTIRKLSTTPNIPNLIDNSDIDASYADSIPKLKPLSPIYLGRIQQPNVVYRLLPPANFASNRPIFMPAAG